LSCTLVICVFFTLSVAFICYSVFLVISLYGCFFCSLFIHNLSTVVLCLCPLSYVLCLLSTVFYCIVFLSIVHYQMSFVQCHFTNYSFAYQIWHSLWVLIFSQLFSIDFIQIDKIYRKMLGIFLYMCWLSFVSLSSVSLSINLCEVSLCQLFFCQMSLCQLFVFLSNVSLSIVSQSNVSVPIVCFVKCVFVNCFSVKCLFVNYFFGKCLLVTSQLTFQICFVSVSTVYFFLVNCLLYLCHKSFVPFVIVICLL